jgi:hypothetical protein
LREYTSPDPATIDQTENTTSSLWALLDAEPGRTAVAVREGDRFVEWSIERFTAEVRVAARGLIGGELYEGLWQDVGTIERLAELEKYLHEHR